MTFASRPTWLATCVMVVAWGCALPLPLSAGEWPQILGPSRNGIAAADEKLAERWPDGGPKVTWRRGELGSGFAGVAVAGGKVMLFHRLEDEEIAECLEAATGKRLWKASFPTTYDGGVSSDHGPR